MVAILSSSDHELLVIVPEFNSRAATLFKRFITRRNVVTESIEDVTHRFLRIIAREHVVIEGHRGHKSIV
jgi:hypothetical protein